MQLRSIMSRSAKWSNLIWSVAIIGVMSAYFERIADLGSYVPWLFGFFFVSWAICLPVSLVILFFRLLRMIGRAAFVYVFIGTCCFYLGNCGLLFGIGDIKRDSLWIVFYWVTVTIGVFVLADIFFMEIPEFQSKRVDK